MKLQLPSPLQQLKSEFLGKNDVQLWIKRDDLIHPEISGNKWRKLELNVLKAKEKKLPILTFGGAFSNHITAVASACAQVGIRSIGIIRGEEHDGHNISLATAKKQGMELHFISRNEYRLKKDSEYIQALAQQFGSFHLVPEGGANFYGVMGCTNILSEINDDFDIFCCAAGTGTTAAGISLGIKDKQRLEIFPALKGGEFLEQDIHELLFNSLYDTDLVDSKMKQISLILDFHFGGFAKLNPQTPLINFVNSFYEEFNISLDLIYNGKMMFGIFERIKNGEYKAGSKIVALHSGGLQGNSGMKKRFKLDLAY